MTQVQLVGTTLQNPVLRNSGPAQKVAMVGTALPVPAGISSRMVSRIIAGLVD